MAAMAVPLANSQRTTASTLERIVAPRLCTASFLSSTVKSKKLDAESFGSYKGKEGIRNDPNWPTIKPSLAIVDPSNQQSIINLITDRYQ